MDSQNYGPITLHLNELESEILRLILSINHPGLIDHQDDLLLKGVNGTTHLYRQNGHSHNSAPHNGASTNGSGRRPSPRRAMIDRIKAMVERLTYTPPESGDPPDPNVERNLDPEYVRAAFLAVINERGEKSLRKPVSVERLWEVFEGEENEPHTLEELTANLPVTKHPDRDLANLISRLNKAFERVGYPIMIKHVTAYQIMERPPEPSQNGLNEPIHSSDHVSGNDSL